MRRVEIEEQYGESRRQIVYESDSDMAEEFRDNIRVVIRTLLLEEGKDGTFFHTGGFAASYDGYKVAERDPRPSVTADPFDRLGDFNELDDRIQAAYGFDYGALQAIQKALKLAAKKGRAPHSFTTEDFETVLPSPDLQGWRKILPYRTDVTWNPEKNCWFYVRQTVPKQEAAKTGLADQHESS